MVTSKKGKETPAEQLLRMIEGSPAPGGHTTPAATPSLQRLLEIVQDAVARLRQLLLPSRREADTLLWNLRVAQRVLWVALAGLGAYVAFDLVFVRPASRLARAPAATGGQAAAPSPESGQAIKPLSDYLAGVQIRNPFTGIAGGTLLAERPVAKTTKQRLEELAQHLVVVGIDRGPRPEAIVEDTSQQRTYFVRIGDEINGLVIRDISANGVLVAYEGEETLLR